MADQAACTARVERFRALMAERGYDAAIVRNNPDLRWLTGAQRTFDDEVAHTAVITAHDLWLHTDSRYYNTFLTRLGSESAWQIDMDQVDPAAWAARRVSGARARVVAVEDTCDLAFFDAFAEACAHASIACLMPRMHQDLCDLRMVKDDEEIALMRHAQSITDAAFEHICGFIKPGLTEQQIRVELENYMLSHGADALSFGTIVATGVNAANPHAQPGETVVERGDLVVMDYGALYHDYHSDMTRTVAVGEPGEEKRHVYDVVRTAHETCAAAAKPGCIGRDIHELAVSVITEAGYGDYFKHGLGHGVGLEIHERPSFGRAWARPVPEGSVITIEPGIYLPGRFGIRLEDFGLMGPAGFEPFTASPHELRVIDC
ncbi:M24 family metallopeptidase [Thermophilibacter immobilis]|jgi:Xaa-Pro aminopeptidase|uniref:Aminopeptidase P family protein n=1 Tax=Thermophilibacter immobilis TaxID=2779519 RepID=A0A7S7RTD8_9ACTN|nr:Xaa-Pro peptidase family protein [Thermophilibacter immobilis]QOY60091.1 aminopeptidase P family protein [Thermophilibacter immobilis]